MTKKMNFRQPKKAFKGTCIQLMLPKDRKNNAQMFSMGLFRWRVNKDIIDKNNDELIQVWSEYSIHQVHKDSRSVG